MNSEKTEYKFVLDSEEDRAVFVGFLVSKMGVETIQFFSTAGGYGIKTSDLDEVGYKQAKRVLWFAKVYGEY